MNRAVGEKGPLPCYTERYRGAYGDVDPSRIVHDKPEQAASAVIHFVGEDSTAGQNQVLDKPTQTTEQAA